MATCRGCGAPIIWVTTVNEKKTPIDEKPEHRYIFGDDERVQLVKTYMPHHATCPEVDRFRKKKGQENGS